MILHGHNDAVHANAQLSCGGFDDADVGLMRHDPIDVVCAKAHFIKRGVGRLSQLFNGMAEDFLALHAQNAGVCVDTPPST